MKLAVIPYERTEYMNIAIILAGGTGTRIGAGIPKQFIKIQNKPILAYTLEIIESNPQIDAIEIVCHKDWLDNVEKICAEYGITKKRWICTGGATFQESTMNGIYHLKNKVDPEDIVVMSFGVAPMTTQEEIDDCIRVCTKHGNAISAAQMDLLLGKTKDGTNTSEPVDREYVQGFANPWAFRYGELLQTYEEAKEKKILDAVEPHTTSLYLALGKQLWFSKHNRQNIKITYKEDIEAFEGYLLLQKQKLKERINQEKEKYRMVSFKEFEILKCINRFEKCINLHNSCIIPQNSGGYKYP